jgi:hypothetical protein
MKARFRFICNNKMKVDFCFMKSAKMVPCGRVRLQPADRAFYVRELRGETSKATQQRRTPKHFAQRVIPVRSVVRTDPSASDTKLQVGHRRLDGKPEKVR